MLPEAWYRAVVVGWFVFFGIFLGTDIIVWLAGHPRVPTFSRVVCRALPWWFVLPVTAFLFVHFLQIYLKK
jgi:hypothetical protein